MVLTPAQQSENAETEANGYGRRWLTSQTGNVWSQYQQPAPNAAFANRGTQAVQPSAGVLVNLPTPSARMGAGNTANRLSTIFGQPSPADAAPTTISRSQPQAELITGANATRTANTAANKQSLSDWMKDYLATKPAVQANANQEAQAIGQVYDTGPAGMRATLAGISRGRQAATNQAASQAIAQAGRRNSLLRMQTGNGSYADRLYGADVSRLATAAAGARYDQDRNDYLTVLGAQQSNAGRRSSLLNSALDYGLQPIDVNNRFESADIGLNSSLGGLEQQNVYAYDTPATRLARRAQLEDMVTAYDTRGSLR